MEFGKLQLGLPPTTPTLPELAELYTAFYLLQRELSSIAGTATLKTSTAIAKGQAVNLSGGLLRLADASLSRPAIGVAISGAASGAKCQFMLHSGYIRGLTGLTADAIAYLGNAGAITFTRPASGIIQHLGFSVSATELFVSVGGDPVADSGGGSGLAATVVVTAPAAATLEHVETVAFVGCTPAKKLLVSLAPALPSDENEPVDLRVLSLSAVAGTDVATVSLIFDELTSGPIKLHLLAV